MRRQVAREPGLAAERWRGGGGSVLIGLASVLALLIAWTVLAQAGVVNGLLLPPPPVLAATALSMVQNGYPEPTPLSTHIGASLRRMALGFVLAALVAVPLGVLAGWQPRLYEVSTPVVAFFRAVPTVSLIPLAIVWFGIGEVSKVVMIAFGSFWPIVTNVIDGVRLVDPVLVRAARSTGASLRQVLLWVILPAAVPRIMTGLRLGLAIAFMVLVSAEMVASEAGLGFLIIDGRRFFRADVVLVGMLVIGVVGASLTAGFTFAEQRLLRWKPTRSGSAR